MGPKGVRRCANAPRAIRPHLAAGHRALQQVSVCEIPARFTHQFILTKQVRYRSAAVQRPPPDSRRPPNGFGLSLLLIRTTNAQGRTIPSCLHCLIDTRNLMSTIWSSSFYRNRCDLTVRNVIYVIVVFYCEYVRIT